MLSTVLKSIFKRRGSEKLFDDIGEKPTLSTAYSDSDNLVRLQHVKAYEKLYPSWTITYNKIPLTFHTPNRAVLWRIQTLFTKEPSTIAWLDRIEPGSTLLDVGANIGLYSIFAAKVRNCRVIALEPESQNYALLNSNIHANKSSEQVTAYCVGLSDRYGPDKLYLSNFSLGSSCHSLGEEVGFDLAPRKSPFVQGSFSITLDFAVQQGMFPVPDYIKIDVDGFEHKAIFGARETLSNSKVKSIIVELNPRIPQHLEVVQFLRTLGFFYNEEQVKASARKEGAFKDVGEWIFRRRGENDLVAHSSIPSFLKQTASTREFALSIVERIKCVPIELDPFPHLVVDNIFPIDYFEKIQLYFPRDEQMIPLSETGRTGSSYKNRLVTMFDEPGFARFSEDQRKFWSYFGGWLYSAEFINGVIEYLWPHVSARLQVLNQLLGWARVRGDALLVSDQTSYKIGPHTDAGHRLVSFLYYLPKDNRFQHCGTSLYKPKNPNFTCKGDRHHPFEPFIRDKTIPFTPNKLLIFVRTDRSFHGVEPLEDREVYRHLLINNIRLVDV